MPADIAGIFCVNLYWSVYTKTKPNTSSTNKYEYRIDTQKLDS